MQGATGLPGKPGKQGREGIPGADVSFLYRLVCIWVFAVVVGDIPHVPK